jgi:ATP-dependent DNA helicase RecG
VTYKSRTYPRPTPESDSELELLFKPLQFFKGIGPGRAQELKEHGLETLYDLLYYLPRGYRDLRGDTALWTAPHGSEILTELTVVHPPRRVRKNLWKAVGTANGAGIELYWFVEELPGPAKGLEKGDMIWIIGRLDRRHRTLRFSHPRILRDPPARRIEPIYRGIPWLGKVLPTIVRELAPRLKGLDPLPESLRASLGVEDWENVFLRIHAPKEDEDLTRLRNFSGVEFERIALDQFLLYFLAVELRRRAQRSLPALPVDLHRQELERIARALPFPLNPAQRQAVREILADLKKTTPMFRLLQGEVGSGKTVVAVIALAVCALAGGQGALLAPTEILANQHMRFCDSFLPSIGIRLALLTRSTPPSLRDEILWGLRHGAIQITVGTHALLEEEVEFRDLRLVVVDEEQRFGVLQRAGLKQKGHSPHTLYLTATPIPRSLLLTLLGEVQVSVLPHKARGEGNVQTILVPPEEKRKVLRHIQEELKKNHRIFFLYPRIEPGDSRYRSVTEMYERLCAYFAKEKVTLLHGKLREEEKLRAMEEFRTGLKPIMVATSVIEVGVDVPEATIMVIGHPELFGLSQLHQLRGRIGRSGEPSACYLLLNPEIGEETLKRLEVFATTADGFAIAEADFELRGSGTIFGTRQSGLPDLPPELFTRHQQTAEKAKELARRIIEEDPHLLREEYRILRGLLTKRWLNKPELILA